MAIHNLIRGTAPPYPGAFCYLKYESEPIRVALFRSRLVPHFLGAEEAIRPGLFIQNEQIYARAGDGGVLRILEGEMNGEPLTIGNLQSLLP